MKFVLGGLLVFVLLVGFVGAQGGWGEFVEDTDTVGVEAAASSTNEITVPNGVAGGEEAPKDSESNFDSETSARETSSSHEESTKYTFNFFLALGIVAGSVIILVFIFFLLFKRPSNRWKKE